MAGEDAGGRSNLISSSVYKGRCCRMTGEDLGGFGLFDFDG
jgi:hypothetical protein